MKKVVVLVLFFLVTGTLSYATDEKPILIITQDGEVDDRSSFMNF